MAQAFAAWMNFSSAKKFALTRHSNPMWMKRYRKIYCKSVVYTAQCNAIDSAAQLSKCYWKKNQEILVWLLPTLFLRHISRAQRDEVERCDESWRSEKSRVSCGCVPLCCWVELPQTHTRTRVSHLWEAVVGGMRMSEIESKKKVEWTANDFEQLVGYSNLGSLSARRQHCEKL